MYADMWMDLLKSSPLDEKYCHLTLKRLSVLFRFHGGSSTLRNVLNFIV